MPRRRKSDDDDCTNNRIGDVMARLRKERGWTLQHVAESLGLSVAHVSALEGGQYTFSASLIERLVRLFQRPLSAFLTEALVADSLAAEWQRTFDTLPERDRSVLLDLSRRMLFWGGGERGAKAPERTRAGGGRLVAIEGIDGQHLHELGCALAARHRDAVVHCPHDYRSSLWRYILESSTRLGRTKLEHRALERTLLFACERLLRNESQVQPALRAGRTVIAPFFAVAPSIYQEAEGLSDRRIVDIVETLLPRPDAVLILRSDPGAAARKGVTNEPEPGQFYSPFDQIELARAAHLHDKAMDELRARGLSVHALDAPDPLPSAIVDAAAEWALPHLRDRPAGKARAHRKGAA